MKSLILAIVAISVLVLGRHEATAQMYGPDPYSPYWDGVQYQSYPNPQQYDPYYQLRVTHYQLYLQQFSGYPVYQPFYQPCCFITGVPVIIRQPGPKVAPRPLPPRHR
jgi:hypothetical protein